MMNKFCVVFFFGFVCLANVNAQQDESFVDYWDYDTQWYNDELDNLGIVSKESNEDGERNVEQLEPIDNEDKVNEIPEVQEDEINNLVESDEIDEVSEEDTDERVQGEINQYLEDQKEDEDESEENKKGLDFNDYLVEDNRLNGFDSDDIKGFEELNRKMFEETKELLAKENDLLEPLNENEDMTFDKMKEILHEDDDGEKKAPNDENGNQEIFDETKQILDETNDDWEMEDGLFDENDNLEDIYDDLNDDLESLFETWRKLSMSDENLENIENKESYNSENDDKRDVNEVFDDNIEINEGIDENADDNENLEANEENNEDENIEEQNSEETKLLVDRDYNYEELYKNENQVEKQPSNVDELKYFPLEDNVLEEIAQNFAQEEGQSIDLQEEEIREGENIPQEDAEREIFAEQDKEEQESLQEEENLAQEVEEDNNVTQNEEIEEPKSQEAAYYIDETNQDDKEEGDYPEEDQPEAIEDNAENEQQKISAKIIKAAAEAHKTVEEFLYGQDIVYLNDNLEKPNDLETQESQDLIDSLVNEMEIIDVQSLSRTAEVVNPENDISDLSDKIAIFIIDHQSELDTSSEDFDKNVAPVYISLKVDIATVITSPNYPEAYPGNNIVDWIFDGEGTGIELNITEFDVDGVAGDYLLVKPGGLDDSGHSGLVFSYALTSEKKYRFLDVDQMFVRFESKIGTAGKGFSFSVRMINSPPEVIEEPVTLPSVEIEEDQTVRVYLGGMSPSEFLNITDEFRTIVADMATMYINSNGIDRGNLTTYDATKVTLVSHCNIGWVNSATCVSVRFGVNLGDGSLSAGDLEEMWTGYVHQDPFAARMRWLGLMEYAPPDRASTLMVWGVLGFGALLCGLMLAFTVWKCGTNNYARMPDFSDTESISSGKKKFSDLYPTPHQNLPPLYDQDFIRYELDDTRADLGGFPNKGYTRDAELYDIDSEEELPHVTNRHTDV